MTTQAYYEGIGFETYRHKTAVCKVWTRPER